MVRQRKPLALFDAAKIVILFQSAKFNATFLRDHFSSISFAISGLLLIFAGKNILDMESVRNVVEVTDTPIKASNGRPLIKRVEKVLMPNGRYRYPVTYIDMTPGLVDVSEFWTGEKRAPGYKLDLSL